MLLELFLFLKNKCAVNAQKMLLKIEKMSLPMSNGLKPPTANGFVFFAREHLTYVSNKKSPRGIDPRRFSPPPGSKIYYGHSRYEPKWCKF